MQGTGTEQLNPAQPQALAARQRQKSRALSKKLPQREARLAATVQRLDAQRLAKPRPEPKMRVAPPVASRWAVAAQREAELERRSVRQAGYPRATPTAWPPEEQIRAWGRTRALAVMVRPAVSRDALAELPLLPSAA